MYLSLVLLAHQPSSITNLLPQSIMSPLTLLTPTPIVLARFSNMSPESEENKAVDKEWCAGIKLFGPTLHDLGVHSLDSNLMNCIEHHHTYVAHGPAKGNQWSLTSVKVVWDMPSGQEIKLTYHMDMPNDVGLLEAVLWRNVRDHLVVEYEEVEDEDFPWEDEVAVENQIEIIGEEYVEDCTRMVGTAFLEKARL